MPPQLSPGQNSDLMKSFDTPGNFAKGLTGGEPQPGEDVNAAWERLRQQMGAPLPGNQDRWADGPQAAAAPPAAPTPPPVPASPLPMPGSSPAAAGPAGPMPPPQTGGSNMLIMNGPHQQNVQFAPTASGGVQAVNMRDANTGASFNRGGNGQWFAAGAETPSAAGMGFNDAQAAVNGSLPNQFQGQLAGVLAALPPGARSDPASIHWAASQLNQQGAVQAEQMKARADLDKNAVLREQLAAQNNPDKLKEQHMLEWSKANPGANVAQVTSEAGRFDAIRKMLGAGSPQQPGSPAAAPAPAPQVPAQPQTIYDAEAQRMQQLGPEVYSLLNQPVAPDGSNKQSLVSDAMTNIYRYDKGHPGYMQQNGPAIVDLLKKNYGESQFGSALNPSALGGINRIINPLHSDSDAELAQDAFRSYLGQSRRMFGTPISGGGPLHPDVLKKFPGLK